MSRKIDTRKLCADGEYIKYEILSTLDLGSASVNLNDKAVVKKFD